MIRLCIIILFLVIIGMDVTAQSASFLLLKDHLPATFINPSIPLEKKINVSIACLDTNFDTDGWTIDQLTSKNSAGSRFIDIKNIDQNSTRQAHIFGLVDIHTLDLGIGFGDFTFLSGHAFRSFGQLQYSESLVELLSKGNAPFIGKTIDIGTAANILSFNEIYLGGQYRTENLSFGAKAKLLFGSGSLKTDRSYAAFTTNPDIYQWNLETDYILRSNGLLNYQNLDSVSFDLNSFSFDNFFSGNKGFGIDAGLSWKLDEKLSLFAGISDFGKIFWDTNAKKYSSKGNYTFEGIDLIDLLGDDQNISISDTLIDIVKLKSENEMYTTNLQTRYHIGGFYSLNDRLTFNALYSIQNRFGNLAHQLFLSGAIKIAFLQAGISYNIAKNNFTSLGLFGKLKAGPFSIYLHTENIFGILNPTKSKNAGIQFGTTLQF